MALIRWFLHPSPAALLEAAADAFLVPSVPGPVDYLLVLRQGGLRDDLLDRAEQRGVSGWFEPPLAVFGELARWLGATERKPLGDFERPALLDHLLRTAGGTTFRDRGRHFLLPIEQLFGELLADGVTPEAFEHAIASLGPRESFEQDRDSDLARLYRAYTMELDRLGLRDGRDTLADIARAVRVSPDEVAERLGGRRQIRIVGLHDLRGGWRPLLAALAESEVIDEIALYAIEALPLPDFLAPHLAPGPERQSAAPRVALDRLPQPHHGIALVSRSDPDRELEWVAVRARELIDSGVPPHRIAVVSRDARPWVERVLRVLRSAGLAGTARRRVALREIPVVRAVQVLLRAAAEGWTRHGLAEIGSQPFFDRFVDVRIVDFIGYRRRVAGLDDWRAALAGLLDEARAAEAREDAAEGDRRGRTLPSAWVTRALERFEGFLPIGRELDQERSLGDWLAWLADWLERDPLGMGRRIARVPEDRWDLVRLDLLGWRGLREAVAGWRTALEKWPEPNVPFGVEAFARRLELELTADVVLRTDDDRGIRVLEALAASDRTFDHVFLVGMNAGAFPRRAPSSLLHSPEDREALAAAGLPLETSREWDAREQSLFRTLVQGARESLALSWCSLDDTGGEAIPSAFVESVARVAPVASLLSASRLPVIRSEADRVHAHRVATIERIREVRRPSPWNGQIESPVLREWLVQRFGEGYVWAPTGIEEYAKCPWAWFSGRLLRLEEREDPDADIDPRVRGAVLHSALRRFYDAAGRRNGIPLMVLPTDRDWALPLLAEALAEALREVGGTVWLGHPALRDRKHAELAATLRAFLEFELEHNDKAQDGRTTAGKRVRTAVQAHEQGFDETLLERRGTTIRFRGRFDRVEVGRDPRAPGRWLAVVDYKSSVYSCPGGDKPAAWVDGIVIQNPLYAHALRYWNPDSEVAWVEYRAINQAKPVHSLPLFQVGRGGVSPNPEAQARLEAALDHAVEHVRRVRAGRFPPAPPDSCRCPPFCHGWDVCRIPGGPRTTFD